MTLPFVDTSLAKSEIERTILELVADGMMTRQIMCALGISKDTIESARRDLRQRGAKISAMPINANQAIRCCNIGNLLSRNVTKGKDAKKLAAEQGRSLEWLNAMVKVYRDGVKEVSIEMGL